MAQEGWSLLYLNQEDCVAAGGTVMTETLKATERSFFLHGKKDFIQPGKPVIRWGGPETEETRGRIMSMPCYLGGKDYVSELNSRGLFGPVDTSGIKFIPSCPPNLGRGYPRATALIIIVDPETLIPVCVMDGAIVSAMRTGAASGVAAKYLANPDAKTFGLVGASVQGMTQAIAIKTAVPSLEVMKIFDIDLQASKKFIAHMSPKLDMEIVAVEHCRDAFIDSDIISTATTARKPYVDPSWYAPGAFHAEISFWDTPPSALTIFDKIYVDDWYQVKHHGVDVSWRALDQGFIDNEKIAGELGEVVAGIIDGRKSRDERIFFNPIGLGIHDLSEAHRVYQNALVKGIGTHLPYFSKSNGWLDSLMISDTFDLAFKN